MDVNLPPGGMELGEDPPRQPWAPAETGGRLTRPSPAQQAWLRMSLEHARPGHRWIEQAGR